MMEATIKNSWYPLQLWLTTIVFIAPILLFLGSFFYHVDYSKTPSNFSVLVLFILFGLAFSSPAFLAIWLIYELLFSKIHSALLIKILISIVSIAGVFITFSGPKGSMAPQLEFVYSASIIISSCFFKVRKNPENEYL